MKNIKKPIHCENLGNGRVKFSLIINFKLLGLILAFILGLALLGFSLYWLGVGIVALAKLIWTIKWWLVGAILLGLLIWLLLTKVNWKALHLPEGKPREAKERNLKWLWAIVALLAIILLGVLLFKGCDREETVTVTEEVTEERFMNPNEWIKLDTYLSEGFNVKYVDYERFDSYGKVLSYDERLQAFDTTAAYYKDWSRLFPYFEGKTFNDNQLAALKRYGLWCGLAGFERSPICMKLQNGEEVLASDLAVVYTAEGKERKYSRASSKEHAKKYAWVLMNVFDGNITIEEILDYPVKSFENVSVKDMYDAEGNYIYTQELKTKLQQQNGNRTTREVLGL